MYMVMTVFIQYLVFNKTINLMKSELRNDRHFHRIYLR